MTSRLDTSDADRFANELLTEAAVVERRLSAAFDRTAKNVADGQRARVRRRSGETYRAISVVDVAPVEKVVGASNWQGVRLEQGTSRMPPYPWAFDDIQTASDELAQAVRREAMRPDRAS